MDTPEEQLATALKRFLDSRGAMLSNNPLDDLIIPLQGGDQLRVPVVFVGQKE